MDGRNGRTDDAKTLSLRLRRGIKNRLWKHFLELTWQKILKISVLSMTSCRCSKVWAYIGIKSLTRILLKYPSKDSYSRRGEQYRSIPLCQTWLSRIHGLCRSDHPFPNISPILHCISTLLMSNWVIMKTRLFQSDFSFPKVNFPFVYHCLYQSVKF